MDPPRVTPKAIVMGERWGCAQFTTEAGSHWQCWDSVTTSPGQTTPQAWTVPWFPERDGISVMTAADHLCAYMPMTRSYRCWERPRRGELVGHELPERMGWANPAYATPIVPNAYNLRDFPRGAFTGGTFGCLLGEVGDLWCVGDDELGQLGDSGHRFVDQGLPTYFVRPNSWDVALGVWHGCAIPNLSSQAWCWGRGDVGQLGAIPATTCAYGKRRIACAGSARAGPVTAARDGARAIRAGDLFTCAADPKGVLCWGANRDAFFGARGSCPAEIRRVWPTLHGTTSAPNAACPAHPERIAGVTEFPARFEVGPRGVCFSVGAAIRCRGAVPSPRGGETAFQKTIVVTSEEMARVMGAHVVHGPDEIAVSPGQDASACAIHADGSVVCWGEGYSPAEAPDLPVVVSFETATLPSIAAVYVTGSPDDWGDDSCVIRRGCTLRPALTPACPRMEGGDADPQDTPTWSELSGSAEQHVGQIVRVRGSLGIQNGSTSLVACFAPGSGKPACCNGSTGTVMLDGVPTPLGLDGLFCAGDESGGCCNAPAYGQTVVATGRLQRASSGWTLADVTLCEPRD